MSIKILFVDDDENVRKSIQRFFRFQKKFDVDFAASGLEALEKLAEQSYPILVTDQLMPGMTGEELLERVKEKYPETIRVILTAYATVELAMRAMNELGVFGFLQKPIKRKDIFTALQKAATRYQENKRIQQLRERSKVHFSLKDLFEDFWLILAQWDEVDGPTIVATYPTTKKPSFDVEQVAVQIFMTFVPVFGQNGHVEAVQMTLPVHYLKMDARVHFDAIPTIEVRGGQRNMVIIVLAPILENSIISQIDFCTTKFAKDYRTSPELNLKTLFQCIQQNLLDYSKD